MHSLSQSAEVFSVHFLVGAPVDSRLAETYRHALSILGRTPVDHEIVPESRSDEFAETVAGLVRRA